MIAITRCDSSPVLIHSSYTCLYTYTEYIYYIHIQKYSIIRLQMLPEKRNRSERSMPANCMKFIHQDLLVYVYHSLSSLLWSLRLCHYQYNSLLVYFVWEKWSKLKPTALLFLFFFFFLTWIPQISFDNLHFSVPIKMFCVRTVQMSK